MCIRDRVKPAGALFDYDSTGSYILGALVERLSGMPLLEYLQSRVLNRLGGFESAPMLKTPDGTAWGDSALICTPRALAAFARFVMNLGAWEGEQILSREFLQAATACPVSYTHLSITSSGMPEKALRHTITL